MGCDISDEELQHISSELENKASFFALGELILQDDEEHFELPLFHFRTAEEELADEQAELQEYLALASVTF